MQKKLLTKSNTHLQFKKKKNSPESGHRGNLPHHIKATYSIILKGEKLKTYPPRPPDVYFRHLFNTVLKSLVSATRKQNEIKNPN